MPDQNKQNILFLYKKKVVIYIFDLLYLICFQFIYVCHISILIYVLKANISFRLHHGNKRLCVLKVPRLVQQAVSTLGTLTQAALGAGTAAGVGDNRSRATLMESDTVWNPVRRSHSRRRRGCWRSLTRSNQVSEIPPCQPEWS